MAGVPRWREVADDLHQRIEADGLAVVDGRAKLPTEVELQDHYRVSRSTIRDALSWLAERGVVESERGKGTYAVFRPKIFDVVLSTPSGWPGGGRDEAVRDAELEGRTPSRSDIEIGITLPAPEVARCLRVPAESPVVSRHRRICVDDRPWVMETTYYPQELTAKAPRLLDPGDIAEGTVEYLHQTAGCTQGGFHDVITVRAPGEDESRFFGLPERASVLVFETFRTAYDAETGRPFRCTVMVWPADRNRLHYTVGRVPAAC